MTANAIRFEGARLQSRRSWPTAPAVLEAAEKVVAESKSVPQRLKPYCKCGAYGTGKPVPLIKTEGKPSFSAVCLAAGGIFAIVILFVACLIPSPTLAQPPAPQPATANPQPATPLPIFKIFQFPADKIPRSQG